MDSKSNHDGDLTSVASFFAGKSVLVTGVSGFLGKMLLWKLLRDVPTCHALVHVLIRPNGSVSSAERLAEILRREPFATLLPNVDLSRVVLVEGDVRAPDSDVTGLGLVLAGTEQAQFDVILHSGGLTQWDAPLEELLETNAYGSLALLRHHLTPGGTFVYVSSAFAAGIKPTVSGEIVREEPVPVEHVCFRTLHEQAKEIQGSRKERGLAAIAMAREHGWWDPYTLSKAAAENLLAVSAEAINARLVVLRPSGLVGAVREPTRGWNDANTGTVPFIVALSSKQLNTLPGTPDAKIDWFPADLAVNAIIAAASLPREDHTAGASYFHLVSHDCNPVLLKEAATAWCSLLELRGFGTIPPIEWKPTCEEFEASIHEKMKWIRRAHTALKLIPLVPSSITSQLESVVRSVDKLLSLARLYSPYMMCEWRFASNNTHWLMNERLGEEDKFIFNYDTNYDWGQLWSDHVTAMYKYAVKKKAVESRL